MTNTYLEAFDQAVLFKESTWWKMGLPSGKVSFGDMKAEVLGFPEENFKTYHDFTALVHPDDYDQMMKAMKDHLDGKTPAYECVYRIKTSTGSYLTFFDYGVATKEENGEISVMGFVAKIKSKESMLEEITNFKQMLTAGDTTVLDIFTKLKSARNS